MRVSTLYTDASGTYRIRADIRENNRSVHIIDIIDNEYGGEADWDDFTDDEKGDIKSLLLDEFAELDKGNEEPYTTGDEESDDEELPSDY